MDITREDLERWRTIAPSITIRSGAWAPDIKGTFDTDDILRLIALVEKLATEVLFLDGGPCACPEGPKKPCMQCRARALLPKEGEE